MNLASNLESRYADLFGSFGNVGNSGVFATKSMCKVYLRNPLVCYANVALECRIRQVLHYGVIESNVRDEGRRDAERCPPKRAAANEQLWQSSKYFSFPSLDWDKLPYSPESVYQYIHIAVQSNELRTGYKMSKDMPKKMSIY